MSQKKEKYSRELRKRMDELEAFVCDEVITFEDHVRREEKQRELQERQMVERRREHIRQLEERAFKWRAAAIGFATALIIMILFAVLHGAQSTDSSAERPEEMIDQTENLTVELLLDPEKKKQEKQPAEPEEAPTAESVYLGEFSISHYCACKICCGKEEDDPWYGITATGTVATEGRTVAVDPSVIPYGSKITICYEDGSMGYYIAEDCGVAIKGNRLDVFMEDHDRANVAGMKSGSVYVSQK